MLSVVGDNYNRAIESLEHTEEMTHEISIESVGNKVQFTKLSNRISAIETNNPNIR